MKSVVLPIIFLSIMLCSCWVPQKKEPLKLPDVSLATKLGLDVDSSMFLYQYTERFGFTDICIHERGLLRINEILAVNTTGFQKLPLTIRQIKQINDIPEKIDSLGLSELVVDYQYKDAFRDIMIEHGEYDTSPDSVISIDITEGYFHFSDTSLLIYKPSLRLLYYEVHECDD
ncbi:MAG: hypothetical protein AAFN93_23590 [Bacteroidota bacterium]